MIIKLIHIHVCLNIVYKRALGKDGVYINQVTNLNLNYSFLKLLCMYSANSLLYLTFRLTLGWFSFVCPEAKVAATLIKTRNFYFRGHCPGSFNHEWQLFGPTIFKPFSKMNYPKMFEKLHTKIYFCHYSIIVQLLLHIMLQIM